MVKSTSFSVSRATVNLTVRRALIGGVWAQHHATSAVWCSKAGPTGPNDQLAEAGAPDGVPVTDGPNDGLKRGTDTIRRRQGVAEIGSWICESSDTHRFFALYFWNPHFWVPIACYECRKAMVPVLSWINHYLGLFLSFVHLFFVWRGNGRPNVNMMDQWSRLPW